MGSSMLPLCDKLYTAHSTKIASMGHHKQQSCVCSQLAGGHNTRSTASCSSSCMYIAVYAHAIYMQCTRNLYVIDAVYLVNVIILTFPVTLTTSILVWFHNNNRGSSFTFVVCFLQWMEEFWKSEPCYAQFGVNGSKCSFQFYLSAIEHFCPPLPNVNYVMPSERTVGEERERGREGGRERGRE